MSVIDNWCFHPAYLPRKLKILGLYNNQDIITSTVIGKIDSNTVVTKSGSVYVLGVKDYEANNQDLLDSIPTISDPRTN